MSFKEQYGPNVAVIGASSNRERYSNKAVRAFRKEGYNVYPVNPKETQVENLRCYPSLAEIPTQIDFVSVYLNPEISMKTDLPAQIKENLIKAAILNPGAESQELIASLKEKGIETLMICSIVSLGHTPQEF